jgi:hypothetical protein
MTSCPTIYGCISSNVKSIVSRTSSAIAINCYFSPMFFSSFSSLESGISTNSSIVAPSPITTPTLLLKMPLYKLSNTSYWLLNFICTPNCYIDPCLKPSSSSHLDDDSNFKSEFATNGAMLYNGPPTCLSNSSCVSHYL